MLCQGEGVVSTNRRCHGLHIACIVLSSLGKKENQQARGPHHTVSHYLKSTYNKDQGPFFYKEPHGEKKGQWV